MDRLRVPGEGAVGEYGVPVPGAASPATEAAREIAANFAGRARLAWWSRRR